MRSKMSRKYANGSMWSLLHVVMNLVRTAAVGCRRLLARRIVFAVSLLDTTLQYHDDCLDDLPSHICLQDANFTKHQTEACRE